MRTRNQRLEEESITKFKNLAPSDWLVREKPNDYGIDLEVEVFDNDMPTGLVFWVQMKATDSEKNKTIRSIQFERTKLQQFRSYPVNVMIVRYSSVRNEFYYVWSNKYLFLEGNTTTETITVKFNQDDILKSDSKKDIEDFLKISELVNSNRFKFPIKTVILDEKGGITSKILNLKNKVKGASKHLILTNDKHEAVLQITYYKGKLVFNLNNLVGASLGIGSIEEVAKPVKVINMGVVLLLAQINRLDEMNEIIEEHDLWGGLVSNQELLLYLVQYLLAGSKMETNTKFIVSCIEANQDLILEAVSSAVLLFTRSSKNLKQHDVIDFFMQEMIRIARKQSEKRLAIQLYNYANYCRWRGAFVKAFSLYNQARRHYSAYCKMPYFLAEIAGVLFELSRYNLSYRLYEESISLDDKSLQCHYLYADALLHAGQYRKSLEVLGNYLIKESSKESSTFSEAMLKFTALNFILENGAPDSQKRRTLEAIDKSPAYETKTTDENIESISKALDSDYICALAWFNLGYAYSLKKDSLTSFVCYLIAALINRNDLNAWLNASWHAIWHQDSLNIFHYIIRSGYYYCGDSFLSKILEHFEHLKSGHKEETALQIQTFIDSILSFSKYANKNVMEFRIIDDKDEIAFKLLATDK